MKIATFNIQNLFHRHKDLIRMTASKCLFNWIDEMDQLIRKQKKDARDLARIKELSFLIGFENLDKTSYAIMRKKGGELFFQGRPSSLEMRANHLTDWRGWTEIKTHPIDPDATQNKARVIAEVNPDILLLQEVEDKSSLSQFNQDFFPAFDYTPYRELLVLQGNDEKGQEVALMTRKDFHIQEVETFSNEFGNNGKLLFDKNLLKYRIKPPSEIVIWLLGMHLHPQGMDKEFSDNIRFKQATRVADLYEQLRNEGQDNIAVAGTFNAVSYCHSLSPLLQKTDLKDISRHHLFKVAKDNGEDAGYYRMGAYNRGVNIKQMDYLLLSPTLFHKIKNCGMNRKAVWPEKRPQWKIYNTVNSSSAAASEHPVIWFEI